MQLEAIHDRIHHRPMRFVQILVVAICVLVNMLDGFDILSASFVSPILTREWGLSPEVLGLVTLGYPLGAVLGGGVSAWLINAFGWRAVFVFGGICAAALIPFVILKLPESLDFIIERKPRRALEKVNAILVRLGLPTSESLPVSSRPADVARGSLVDLFRPPVLNRTLMMALAYFFYMTSSYFILNWANQLRTDAGFSDTQGLSIAILINIGGIAGGMGIGLLSIKLPFKPLANATMLAMGLAIIAFGFFANSLALVAACSILIGFGIFGAAVVLYGTAAQTFPAWVRATGIGMSMSAGRVGSMVGPAAAGLLLGAGLGRAALCLILAMPVIISVVFLARVPLDPILEQERGGTGAGPAAAPSTTGSRHSGAARA